MHGRKESFRDAFCFSVEALLTPVLALATPGLRRDPSATDVPGTNSPAHAQMTQTRHHSEDVEEGCAQVLKMSATQSTRLACV